MRTPDCRDCKHCHIQSPADPARDICYKEPRFTFFCRIERDLRISGCGPEGANFEPKPEQQPRPWWAFWRKK